MTTRLDSCLAALELALPLIEEYVQGRPEVADIIRDVLAQETLKTVSQSDLDRIVKDSRAPLIAAVVDEVHRRYRAGEREIVVSRGLYEAYSSTLTPIVRTDGCRAALLRARRELAYKDARVVHADDVEPT